MTFLVAFHGLPRAGKGTAAQALIDQKGFQRHGFADAVYRQVAQTFGVREEDLRSDYWKRNPIKRLAGYMSDNDRYKALLLSMNESLSEPRTSRYHLRRWATEFRRAQNHLYWVEQLKHILEDVRGDIVVDDLRFYDTEYPFLQGLARYTRRDFRVIEIIRPGLEQAEELHVSDNRLPFHAIDHVLENIEGSPAALGCRTLGYLYATGE